MIPQTGEPPTRAARGGRSPLREQIDRLKAREWICVPYLQRNRGIAYVARAWLHANCCPARTFKIYKGSGGLVILRTS